MFAAVEAFLGRLWVRLALVAASLIWQLFMVIYRLGETNHYADEPIYATTGWNYLHGRFDQNLEHPPAAKYLIGLAQLWWGEGITSGRILAAIFVMVAAAILGLLVASEAGFWGGLFAANLFVFMPLQQQNFAASAMLEPFMISFLVFALAAAWVWHRTGIWLMLWLAGAFFAIAVSSKISAAVVAIAFVVVMFNRHRWWQKLLGAAGLIGAFWGVFQFTYLQLGYDKAINYMLTFQGRHNEVGHNVVVDGATYVHPPWWSTLWFMVNEAGWPLTLMLVAFSLIAIAWRPTRLTVYLGAALAALLVFYLFVSKISLAHYFLAFMWLLVALAAVGFGRLTTWASSGAALVYQPRFGPRGTRQMARITLAASIVLIALVTATATITVRHNAPSGLALVKKTLLHQHKWGSVLVVGEHNNLRDYLAGHWATDTKHGPYSAIYVGTDPRFGMTAEVKNYIEAHENELTRVDLRKGTYLLIGKNPIRF